MFDKYNKIKDVGGGGLANQNSETIQVGREKDVSSRKMINENE